MHYLILATLKIYLINTDIGSFLKAHVIKWISDNTKDQFNVKSSIAMMTYCRYVVLIHFPHYVDIVRVDYLHYVDKLYAYILYSL